MKEQQQQQPLTSHDPSSSHAAAEQQFSEGVGTLLMATEELRRSVVVGTSEKQEHEGCITVWHLIQWRQELEGILSTMDTLDRWIQDAAGSAAPEQYDLFRHCQLKAVLVAQQVLNAVLQFVEPDAEEDGSFSNAQPEEAASHEEVRRDAQGAIARITELNLLLYHSYNNNTPEGTGNDSGIQTAEEMVQSYVSFQRTVLRLRARPAIVELVEARQNGRIITPSAVPDPSHHDNHALGLSSALPGHHVQVIHHHDDDDHNDDEANTDQQPIHLPEIQPFHAPVLTVILGEAAALIHPLLAWQATLPPPSEHSSHDPPVTKEPPIVTSIRKLCQDSVNVLDEQAQTLVKRISDWYWEDRPINSWMEKGVHDNPHESVTTAEQRRRVLAILDGLVSEMKFACEVLARYQSLIHQIQQQNLQTVIAHELLPEWTWKYAALERFLVMQQWQSALETAVPFEIKIGTLVQVPSVVEDAQYLSTRALERAASTRSLQAIGTVAHAVSHDVWSMDMDTGVYQALMDRRGCWSEPVEEKKEADSRINTQEDPKNDFAAALLDALDDDLGPKEARSHEKAPSSNPTRAPTSGGFLSALVGGGDEMKRIQLDTQFCALNGIYAAAGACRSLETFLDALLSPDDEDTPIPAADNEKASAMIQLAREDLSRYANGYQTLLAQSIEEAVKEWCGSGQTHDSSGKLLRVAKTLSFDRLCLFFRGEPYDLNANDFAKQEAEERLERELITPLKQTLFFEQLSKKCDEEILRESGEHLASVLSDLIIKCLWDSKKKFTDWGSLLLSKQLRLLQAFVVQVTCFTTDSDLLAAPSLIHRWERLSQVVTVLQLEKPSDWLPYQPSSQLSPDELHQTLSMRIDFSNDAIDSIVATVRKQVETPEQQG